MNKVIISGGIIAIILSVFLPLTTIHAQSFTEENRDEIRRWRSRSSTTDRKIRSLGKREEEIAVPILFGITPDNLSPNFGDPRSGGRKHEGLDIMAPKGVPIASPTDAIVLRVGTGASSGYYVYTANPGGETFAYMHLDEMSELEEGDEIEKGDLIGYVGNSGNASGGATHLHFEIQVDGDATDPFPRLKRIFPLADKIKSLENILDDRDDEKKFAEYMVSLYRKEFILAQGLTLEKTIDAPLPKEIETALKTVPVTVSKVGTIISSDGTLKLGTKGGAVVTLQKFLISKNVGSARLVTADGSFGPITKKALAEYQASVGLTADGVYGPRTKAYITSQS